jgi:excisionase family DNA binding protein
MDENDRLLTVTEVATMVRATPDTVRRWLRQGRLKGILPGGDRMGYRIRESEVRRFLSSASTGGDVVDSPGTEQK